MIERDELRDLGIKKLKLLRTVQAAIEELKISQLRSEPEPEEDGGEINGELRDQDVTCTDQEVGRGGSGIVHRGELRLPDGSIITAAIKKLHDGATAKEVRAFMKEFTVSVRAAERCPRACRIYGLVRHEGELRLVMKLYRRSLHSFLDLRRSPDGTTCVKPLCHEEVVWFAIQILEGLAQLHAEGIVVQDLKPGNLLMDEDGELVVSDFGLAAVLSATIVTAQTTTVAGGTPAYKAPEQYDADTFGKVSEKTDMWAFACVVVELLTGFPPWRGKQPMEIMMTVAGKRQSPQMPAEARGRLAEVLRRCFSHDQSARPTAQEGLSAISEMESLAVAPIKELGLPPTRASPKPKLQSPSVPPEELFQVIATGELMNMMELFDAGITKDQCRSLSVAAAEARQILRDSLAGAQAKADVLGRGLAAVEQTRMELMVHSEQVDAAIDKELAAAREAVNSCLDQRRNELKTALATQRERCKAALDDQHAHLTQQRDAQLQLCTKGLDAAQQDDRAVVDLLTATQAALRADAVAEVVPAAAAFIPHSFDVASVTGPAVSMLSKLGQIGLPPPDLQGYSAPKPTYAVGQQIEPNKPVGRLAIGQHGLAFAAHGLPSGLSLDPTTGVISGTPTAVTEPGAPVLEVTARGHGGVATANLRVTVIDSVSVTFTEARTLGLKFTPNKQTGNFELLAVNPGTQAEKHSQLSAGLIVRSVGGSSVAGKNYEEVLGMIKAGGRPLSMTFSPGGTVANSSRAPKTTA